MTSIHVAEYIGFALGSMLVLIGISGVFLPVKMSKKFGIQIRDGESGIPYVSASAVRDLALGLIVFALLATGNLQMTGIASLCMTPIALCDFYVVFTRGDRPTSLMHLMGAIGLVAYGIWILSAS
jgi:hypothetical protein